MEIHERIKQARKEAHDTQADIAKLLGTTREQISKYENGVQELPCYRLKILCQHWKISADWVLGIKDEPSQSEGTAQ